MKMYGRCMEKLCKMWEDRDIKLLTTVLRRNYLVSELSCKRFFSENLLAIEMEKTQVFMNKPVYLDISILEIS